MHDAIGTTCSVAAVLLLFGAAAEAQDLIDHGVGTPLAERRGVVGVQDANGRNLVIGCSTDLSLRGWILVTDIDTGETEQIYAPEGVPAGAPYGSLVARSGRFYTGMGDVLLELDPTSREWTFQHRFAPASAFLRIIEGPDGVIWAGDVYRAGLVSYDPATGETADHGPMDEREKYLSHLAYDDAGWLYCGIGTGAWKIVAYNPEAGEKRQIVPEDELGIGTAYVQTGIDGNAYGRAGEQWYRLSGGEGVKIEASEVAAELDMGDIYWGDVKAAFPDGREVAAYNMVERYLTVRNPQTDETTRIDFDYQSEGSAIRVVVAGPDGRIYANSAHPSRFIVYDPAKDELHYEPDPIALKGFGVQGKCVFGGHYGGGKLYVFDTTRPWNMHPAPPRIEGSPAAEALAAIAEADGGSAIYLDGHDVVFLKGEDYGSQLHVPVSVPRQGRYYLLVSTYQAPSYCRGQVLLDGEQVGKPFDPRAPAVRPGPILCLGPFDLAAGEHRVSIRTIDGGSENPWLSVRGIALTRERPEDDALVPPTPNPRLVGEFAPDINVPWGALAHPDGDHVLISGNPGYGVIGGGVAVRSLSSGENLLLRHTDLVENQMTMDMAALPNGDVVGCSSISGGHGTTPVAEEALLYLLDWETKQVQWRVVPIPGLATINAAVTAPDGNLYCIGSNSTFFVFDPRTRKVIRTRSLSVYGSVPYRPMTAGPDGSIYLALRRAILRIEPGTYLIEKVADAPGSIGGGLAVLDGGVYFAVGSHLWSAGL
ncbi:MAG: hypothetical protein ACP5KN_00960 [Armatimonadota bacterium]